MRKIWIPYSERSELSLLESIINRIKKSNKLELVLTDITDYVSHLEKDENLGKVYEKCYEIIKKNKIDIALIGFDRREMVFCALAAYQNNIPLIHLYAGDLGTNHPDEINRMLISRLSHILCTHSEKSAENLLKLGEESWRVKYTGSTSFDDINLLSLGNFTKKYNIPKEFDLVLYHSEPESKEDTKKEIKNIFENLDKFTIVIYPNRDRYHEIVIKEIEKHRNDKNTLIFRNLPKNDYLTALKYAKRAIGNSSSFVLEAPFFGTKVVHIGKRNKDRSVDRKIKTGGSDKLIKILETLKINNKLLNKKYF